MKYEIWASPITLELRKAREDSHKYNTNKCMYEKIEQKYYKIIDNYTYYTTMYIKQR